jgi:hypothetical protein
MQAARTMQVNTGFESRCFVTFGITAVRERKQSQGRIHWISTLVLLQRPLLDPFLSISVARMWRHLVAWP